MGGGGWVGPAPPTDSFPGFPNVPQMFIWVGGGGCRVVLKGVGVWNPKVLKLCVPKMAQIKMPFCKFHLFPTMKSGSEGGGGLAPHPTPGDAEL